MPLPPIGQGPTLHIRCDESRARRCSGNFRTISNVGSGRRVHRPLFGEWDLRDEYGSAGTRCAKRCCPARGRSNHREPGPARQGRHGSGDHPAFGCVLQPVRVRSGCTLESTQHRPAPRRARGCARGGGSGARGICIWSDRGWPTSRRSRPIVRGCPLPSLGPLRARSTVQARRLRHHPIRSGTRTQC